MAESSDIPMRLVDIFPPGFDNKTSSKTSINASSKSSSSFGGRYQFLPEQLYRLLTQKYDRQNHVESVQINSVWYGKEKKGVRHEFIVIEVEDTEAKLINYIVLDRNNEKATKGKASCSQSCNGMAMDAFRVSYDGDLDRLLQQCRLHHYRYLEELEFTQTEPLFLYQLATLVYDVSKSSEKYSAMGENCYWFGGLIWECMRVLRPNAGYKDHRAIARGRLAGVRYTPNKGDVEATCKAYLEHIEKVEKRLEESMKKWENDIEWLSSKGARNRYHAWEGSNATFSGGNYLTRMNTCDTALVLGPTVSPMDPDRSSLSDSWSSRYGRADEISTHDNTFPIH